MKLTGMTLIAALALAGCTMAPMPQNAPTPYNPAPQPPLQSTQSAARTFVNVVQRVEPIAEAFCRETRPDLNCDFQIVIDDRAGQPPNAFHTLDPQTKRPLIGFTLALIQDARNADELAFVLGHEAGHHIAGHLGRTQNTAVAGALILGTLTALGGGGTEAIESAQQLGGAVGARTYSKNYELEADEVGTIIAWRAGYDPILGAGFFSRLPDPGDSFLGSHPPNQQRIVTVRETLARINRSARR